MAKSITSINSLLVKIKTINQPLQVILQQHGFNVHLCLGSEQEYTVKTLISAINTLSIQLLTITANRSQFIQHTNFNERTKIETCLKGLLDCLQKTIATLDNINFITDQCDDQRALIYTAANGEQLHLKLHDAIHFIELIKPYCRILENITTQQRIHALSAILESIISKTPFVETEKANEKTQNKTLELSQQLLKQAL